MMKVLELSISSTLMGIFAYKVGNIIFDIKDKKLNLLDIILIILLIVFTTTVNILNLEELGGIYKILLIYMICCLFYKLIYKDSISKTVISSLLVYICMFISEVIIAILASVILSTFGHSLVFLKNTIFINTLILFLAYIIIIINKNTLIQFANNKSNGNKGLIIIIIIVLIALALLLYRIPLSDWKLDVEFIATMIILLCFCIIGIYMLKQRSDIQKTTSMYQQVVRYSNATNKLLEDYRVVSHEHKNQLSIIRQMIKSAKNEEIIEYIDNLIDKRNYIKYKWVADLNNIPLEGLKGLINYKLLEMEEKSINVSVTISKEVLKFKNKLVKIKTSKKDRLYSIVGVYLDNAIQASIKSKEKEVSIEMYKDKKELVLNISNTYVGEINIDRLDEYGYTTKGKNHGIGLHIVKKILEEDKTFRQSRKILDNYYIQELRMDLNDQKKTTK